MSTDGTEQETSKAAAPTTAPTHVQAQRKKALWVLIALVVVAVIGGMRWKRRAAARRGGGIETSTSLFTGHQAGAAELAFLAPIAPGSRVGGYRVMQISNVREGLIHVLMAKNGAEFQTVIALGDDGRPGGRFGRYGVYVWEPHPTTAMTEAAEALARGLRASVDRAAPTGLTAVQHNP